MILPPRKTIKVSATKIRSIFNESSLPKQIVSGDLRQQLVANRHIQKPANVGEPFCTHSQLIRYFDRDNQWVAEVHQYLRPDNTLGASGKPDPKRLKYGNTIYSI